jgi:hypothetical protein
MRPLLFVKRSNRQVPRTSHLASRCCRASTRPFSADMSPSFSPCALDRQARSRPHTSLLVRLQGEQTRIMRWARGSGSTPFEVQCLLEEYKRLAKLFTSERLHAGFMFVSKR